MFPHLFSVNSLFIFLNKISYYLLWNAVSFFINFLCKNHHYFLWICQLLCVVVLLLLWSVRIFLSRLGIFLRHFFVRLTPGTPNFARAFYLYLPILQVTKVLQKVLACVIIWMFGSITHPLRCGRKTTVSPDRCLSAIC